DLGPGGIRSTGAACRKPDRGGVSPQRVTHPPVRRGGSRLFPPPWREGCRVYSLPPGGGGLGRGGPYHLALSCRRGTVLAHIEPLAGNTAGVLLGEKDRRRHTIFRPGAGW